MVGTDNTFVDAENLNPGHKAPFSLMVDKKEIPDAANYEVSLSWDNQDGSEEYLDNVNVIKDSQSISNKIQKEDR